VSEKFGVRLKRVRHLNPSTRDFRFERADGKDVEFAPGQFFRFTFQDELGDFERSYSLCNFFESLHGSSFLDLVVSTVEKGRATKVLFADNVGLGATVSGPFGRLILPSPMPRRLVLIATSVGLAPFMPMLASLFPDSESSTPKVQSTELLLLLGVRNPGDFFYRKELLRLDSKFKNFELRVCYSQDMPEQSQSFEYHGYVTRQLQELSLNVDEDQFLICGNPKMIDDCYEHLKSQGFPSKKVVREKYVFAKDNMLKKKKVLNDKEKLLIAEKMKKFLKRS
jgi:ferredoxin-NADP reductase